MPPLKPYTSMVEYSRGKIRTKAYLSIPEGGDVPAVLVLHAWWGLNDFIKKFCVRLTKAGFIAFAPDLYNGKTAATIPDAKKLRSKMDRKTVPTRLRAAADCVGTLFAASTDRVGVVGFSLGAYWALWLANQKSKEVRAVVPFYGTGPGDYGKSKASFLGHYAQHDDYVSPASLRRLEARIRSAGRPVTFHIYPNTSHWFFEEDRADAYNPKASKLAWKRTTDFLHRSLD